MTINKEILIYHNLPYKKYRWISYISIIQVGFIGFNLIVLPTPKLMQERQDASKSKIKKKPIESLDQTKPEEIFEQYESNSDYDSSTLFQKFKDLSWKELLSFRNISDNVTQRPLLSSALLAASILVSSGFCLYARRNIHKVYLLPGDRVRFHLFSAFAIGKPPRLEVPLQNVSCVHDRKSANNYSILKIKGYQGYHLIHKSEGQFLEPKLYDKYVAFSRPWFTK